MRAVYSFRLIYAYSLHFEPTNRPINPFKNVQKLACNQISLRRRKMTKKNKLKHRLSINNGVMLRLQKLWNRGRRWRTKAVSSTDCWLKFAKEQRSVEQPQPDDPSASHRSHRQNNLQPRKVESTASDCRPSIIKRIHVSPLWMEWKFVFSNISHKTIDEGVKIILLFVLKPSAGLYLINSATT